MGPLSGLLTFLAFSGLISVPGIIIGIISFAALFIFLKKYNDTRTLTSILISGLVAIGLLFVVSLYYNFSIIDSLEDSYYPSSQTIEGCKKLDDVIIRSSCFSKLADQIENPNICEEADNPDNCFLSYVRMNYNHISFSGNLSLVCNEIKDNKLYALCKARYLNSVTQKEDCIILEKGKVREECVSSYAENSVDLDSCEEIEDKYRYGECIMKVQAKLGNESYCGTLSSERDQDKCIIEISKATENVKLCEKMNFDYNIDLCLRLVAVELGDSSMCGDISDKSHEKQLCYQQF